MSESERVKILLVEDNPDHAMMVKRALSTGKLINEIAWVKNGEEALDYLFQRGAYADGANAPTPGLILLDLKLPKRDGFEVLQQLKQNARLKPIPVIVLTTSAREEEIHQCYALGANSYIVKPVQFSDFTEKVRQLELYWVLVNRLPGVHNDERNSS